jgi:NAD(P)-dependent dehydrogenase (short-subunit alcohol dehydrogenase family)
VRANCIAPGLVRTDFAKALWSDAALLAKRVKDSPLARIGDPDEIAGAAAFLASRADSFTMCGRRPRNDLATTSTVIDENTTCRA